MLLFLGGGRPFPDPLEVHEPTVLAEHRASGVNAHCPASGPEAGSGGRLCFVLDRLAEEPLTRSASSFRRPKHSAEPREEESMVGDDGELSGSEGEETVTEPAAAAEGGGDGGGGDGVLGLDAPGPSARAADVLEPAADAAAWKRWRIRLDQMHQHSNTIQSLVEHPRSYTTRLQQELSSALQKVSSNEEKIREELQPLIQQYLSVRARLHQEEERRQQADARVTEKRQELTEISAEARKTPQEMKDRDSSVSAGAPALRIRHSLTRLKQEVVQMDQRTGVVQHSLLPPHSRRSPP